MNGGISRRRFLEAGAGATVAVVAAAPAAATDVCDDVDQAQAELEDARTTLQALESEREALLESVRAAQATIDEGRGAARGPHPFDEATRAAAAEVGLAARPGMVFLEMRDDVSVTTASAWFVDDHHLLTNRHNVEDVTPDLDLAFWTLDGERHAFEVVAMAEEMGPDVALLRTDATAPAVLEIGSSSALEPGDRLVQVGNPGGFGKWVVTLGELLEVDDFGDLISSVPGIKGVSGSPLLDMDGRVVGVTYGGRPHSTWEPGTRPVPTDRPVQTTPLVPESDSMHVPIEQAMDLMEGWT